MRYALALARVWARLTRTRQHDGIVSLIGTQLKSRQIRILLLLDYIIAINNDCNVSANVVWVRCDGLVEPMTINVEVCR